MKEYKREELEKIVKECVTKADMCRALGLVPKGGSYRIIDNIIISYNLNCSHFLGSSWKKGKKVKGYKQRNLDEILVKNSTYKSTHHLKDRLFNEGLKECKCEICGYIENLELHHINGDATDNRLENLQILCPNCHSKTPNFRHKNSTRIAIPSKELLLTEEEVQERDLQRKISKRKNPNMSRDRKNIKNKIQICLYCGKEFTNHSIQKYCSRECYIEDNKGNRPTVFQLIQDVRDYKNFTQIGKKYGVSDNAVRKWCKLYSLPIHIEELRDKVQNLFK